MSKFFDIKSSSSQLFKKAKKVAVQFAEKQIKPDTVGITILGSIVRGYYDSESDIDITIFKKYFRKKYETDTILINGFNVHYFKVDFQNEKKSP